MKEAQYVHNDHKSNQWKSDGDFAKKKTTSLLFCPQGRSFQFTDSHLLKWKS